MKFMKFQGIREGIAIGSLGLFLASILNWSLLRNLSTTYRDRTDLPYFGWVLWYDHRALVTGRIFHWHAYFDSIVRYPMPYSLCYSSTLFAPSLLFSVFFGITHNLSFSVNALCILEFAMSFLAGYFAIKSFVTSPFPSLLGAFIYTFNPLTFAHFYAGHLDFLTKYFLPLFLLYGYRTLTKPSLKNAFFLFLIFTLNGISVLYFEVFSVLSVLIFCLPFVWKEISKRNINYFATLLKYGSIAIVFVPLLWYFNVPYLEFSQKEGIIRTLSRGSNMLDWVSSIPQNLIYGGLTSLLEPLRGAKDPLTGFNYAESTLFPNVIPTLLAMIGIFAFEKHRRAHPESGPLFWGLVALLGFSFVLSFGPFFSLWNGGKELFKLPYYFLYAYTPLLDAIRAPARFQFVFYLPFSLFAAYGAKALLNQSRPVNRVLPAILMLFLLAENINIAEFTQTSTVLDYFKKPVSEKVRSILSTKKTFHFPTFVSYYAPMYLTWDAQTSETMVNGFAGSYFPQDFIDYFVSNDENFLQHEQLRSLKALGVDTVVIHKDWLKRFFGADFPGRLPPELTKIYEDDDVTLANLDRVGPEIKPCTLPEDFSYDLQVPLSTSRNGPLDYTLLIRNKRDCFLTRKLRERYTPVETEINGIKRQSYLAFPLIIGPQQAARLERSLKIFKNRFDHLPAGTTIVRIRIPLLRLDQTFNVKVSEYR